MSTLPATPRTSFGRLPARGSHELELIHQILDEGLVCHVSWVHEGYPVTLPSAYVRVDDHIYLHGSVKNRTFAALAAGAPACLVVTLLDGLVLARSQFHHSANYRSAVLFGSFAAVTDVERKRVISSALCDHLVPGRSGASREPDAQELKGTLIIGMPLREGSAKCRSGPPLDAAEDLELPHWAGVVPVELRVGRPIADAALRAGTAPTAEVLQLCERGSWSLRR
jgi:nitroimidazol reductase NimA-like FMN-containing flavoprotein (pyridoxamine 5'-phosphate oxidase superfamily)